MSGNKYELRCESCRTEMTVGAFDRAGGQCPACGNGTVRELVQQPEAVEIHTGTMHDHGLPVYYGASPVPNALPAPQSQIESLQRALAESQRELAELCAWQPIETAPKDGTRVDLWIPRDAKGNDGGAHLASDCEYVDGRWMLNGDFDMPWFQEATHWRPLLVAPGAELRARPSAEEVKALQDKLSFETVPLSIPQALIEQLKLEKAQVKALEADKVRLDWLQSKIDPNKQRANNGYVEQRIQVFNNLSLREAIDEAMKK